jgi:hypothetical protein
MAELGNIAFGEFEIGKLGNRRFLIILSEYNLHLALSEISQFPNPKFQNLLFL